MTFSNRQSHSRHTERMIKHDRSHCVFAKLIQIDSANGNELAVARVLQAELEAADIPTKLIPYKDDRVNLVAQLNHGDRVLGFTGHEDVVSPGDENA